MAFCPYAKKCGGCQLQNLEYEEQLSFKQSRVIRALGRFCHVDEIVGMESPFYYRNKVQSAFSFLGGRTVCGIYQSSTRRVLPVDECMIEDRLSQKIVRSVRSLAGEFRLKSYDLRSGRGFLRHVLVRRGFATGEVMVVIVTSREQFPRKRDFASALLKKHKEITTLVWNINPTETPLLLGDESEILHGPGYIHDILLGRRFRISPRSFYQVNPVQTEKLYSAVRDFCELTGKETVVDAYCGTGTIGLTVADRAKRLIGIESSSDAVEDARINAELNGIENAEFFAFDAGEMTVELAQKKEKVDIVITDPPRAGCSREFLTSVASLAPKKVVYVSCNYETLERDVMFLTKNGYKVKKVQPFDLFPHTSHVETVVLLSLK